jgi:hypothetical protein
MGEAPSEAIYLERQNGRFKNIYDFLKECLLLKSIKE